MIIGVGSRISSELNKIDTTQHFLLNTILSQDDPESANSEIFFDMKQTEVKSLFRLESIGKGVTRIYPATSLKGKYGNYSIQIIARDGGDPAIVREENYNICVQVKI